MGLDAIVGSNPNIRDLADKTSHSGKRRCIIVLPTPTMRCHIVQCFRRFVMATSFIVCYAPSSPRYFRRLFLLHGIPSVCMISRQQHPFGRVRNASISGKISQYKIFKSSEGFLSCRIGKASSSCCNRGVTKVLRENSDSESAMPLQPHTCY